MKNYRGFDYQYPAKSRWPFFIYMNSIFVGLTGTLGGFAYLASTDHYYWAAALFVVGLNLFGFGAYWGLSNA